jgi:hypothetical protein
MSSQLQRCYGSHCVQYVRTGGYVWECMAHAQQPYLMFELSGEDVSQLFIVPQVLSTLPDSVQLSHSFNNFKQRLILFCPLHR